jgi:hypothetical protein
MENPETPETMIVHLTRGRPIRIKPANWTEIVRVSEDSGRHGLSVIAVRQHNDGRILCYGHSAYIGESEIIRIVRAGQLLPLSNDGIELIDAIMNVATAINNPGLGQECIDGLPPVNVD